LGFAGLAWRCAGAAIDRITSRIEKSLRMNASSGLDL
jgi:hypothetical protein